MLPDDPDIRRPLQFLQESEFSSNVILSLAVQPPHTLSELLAAVEELETKLQPPLVKKVISGLPETGINREIQRFLQYAPQLIPPRQLAVVKERLTPANIRKHLQDIYLKMMNPGGSFLMPLWRSDPLGLKTPLLEKLNVLSRSMGYRVQLQQGHFVSPDGRHALMILKTPVKATDPAGARRLMNSLQETLTQLPEHVTVDIISGHRHTLSNETIIKQDIRLTLAVAAIGFLVLFGMVFRDPRAVLVFLLPSLFILIALGLLALFYDSLSYFVLGMGVVVTGIAVDYGIHTYLAVKTGGSARHIIHILRPLMYSAVTTVAIFASFYLLRVHGYKQLATFSILALLLCLGGAIFLLPRLLRTESPRSPVVPGPLLSRRQRPAVLGTWGVFLVLALAMLPRITLQTDFTALDGTAPEILAAEDRFRAVWATHKQDPAVLVIPALTREEALQRNETVYQKAASGADASQLASLAPLWPSRETRQRNLQAWNHFWKNHADRLRNLLLEQGKTYQFSKTAFDPFFQNLTSGRVYDTGPEDIPLIQQISERFFLSTNDGWRVLTFFPDTPAWIEKMTAVSQAVPGAFIVSQNGFARTLSRSIAAEIRTLALLATALIPLLTILLLRRLRLAFLALVPVISGVLAVLLVFGWLDRSLNAPVLFALMVIVGLCIDYGLFLVYVHHQKSPTGTPTAVTLSALSTLIGAGVLLLADHPALLAVGITMVSGVLAGFLSAMTVIPALMNSAGDKSYA